jgi:sulfur relay (sulfurtransferase) DsrC/TusE family protein
MNQLKTGIKIESEHKKTIRFIRGFVKQNKKFPTNKQIYTSIAKDHLKEHKNYYSKLKQARL